MADELAGRREYICILSTKRDIDETPELLRDDQIGKAEFYV